MHPRLEKAFIVIRYFSRFKIVLKLRLRENEPARETFSHEWFCTNTRFDTEAKRQFENGLLYLKLSCTNYIYSSNGRKSLFSLVGPLRIMAGVQRGSCNKYYNN